MPAMLSPTERLGLFRSRECAAVVRPERPVPILLASGGAGTEFPGHFGQRRSGQSAEHIEHGGVRRDLQIEVDETVEQYPRTSQQSSEGHGSVPAELPAARGGQTVAVEEDQKPQHQREAGESGFYEQLGIVVMRFIDEKIGIERAKARINRGEGSESPTEKRAVGKHSQTVGGHVPANAGSQVSQPAENLPLPNKKKQPENQETQGKQADGHAGTASLVES